MPKRKLSVEIKVVEKPSMAKAIRAYCIDCGGGVTTSVRDCNLKRCPLFPYRFGKNPQAAIKYLEKTYNVKIIK